MAEKLCQLKKKGGSGGSSFLEKGKYYLVNVPSGSPQADWNTNGNEYSISNNKITVSDVRTAIALNVSDYNSVTVTTLSSGNRAQVIAMMGIGDDIIRGVHDVRMTSPVTLSLQGIDYLFLVQQPYSTTTGQITYTFS